MPVVVSLLNALYFVFLVGTVLCVRRRAFRLLIVPWGIFLYLLTIHAPMHVESRYLVQANPFLPMLLACVVSPTGREDQRAVEATA